MSDYPNHPHKCPVCGASAYVGFGPKDIRCTAGGCEYYDGTVAVVYLEYQRKRPNYVFKYEPTPHCCCVVQPEPDEDPPEGFHKVLDSLHSFADPNCKKCGGSGNDRWKNYTQQAKRSVQFVQFDQDFMDNYRKACQGALEKYIAHFWSAPVEMDDGPSDR